VLQNGQLLSVHRNLAFVEQFQPINQFAEHAIELAVILPFRKIKDVISHMNKQSSVSGNS
jgi:hypothetical protein